MRYGIEDTGLCYSLGPAVIPETSNANGSINFESHKGNGSKRTPNNRTAVRKSTPSKWDDAQKWLSGMTLSRSVPVKSHSKTSKPRNFNADDRRLIASASQREREEETEENKDDDNGENNPAGRLEVETKKVDRQELSSLWRINKKSENNGNGNGDNPVVAIRSVCVRDMGTEMTPIGSQEPSRTGTPIRATTPVARSPNSSGSSTPVRTMNHNAGGEQYGTALPSAIEKVGQENNNDSSENQNGTDKKMNALETRAVAWDEAERAKYMARYKREEVKIQAWENHQKRKAEMEMKKMEVKAERKKARAQEKFANKLAASKRIAEEKRAEAEAKLNEQAIKTSERAEYIRRTGHLPSFSFNRKLPCFCW